MDLTQVQIETERLILKPVTMQYAEDIFNGYQEPITKYMNYGPVENIDELKPKILDRNEQMKKGELLFLVVLLKTSGEFLGCLALEDLDTKTPEMGGWIKHSSHGNHYGKEAALGLKTWAEQNIEYDYLRWPCAKANTASTKVAEAMQGVISKVYRKTTASGNVWDGVEYWIYKKVD